MGERRLAAVMFTDIVGYTALSQRDEKQALKLLDRHNEILRPILTKHEGTEIKTIGDSFLVEFSSALAATECAIEIQQTLAEADKNRIDSPILLRIGLHLGDVVRRGGDIFGDAVNIASRIEPLAPPGGICVSEEVYSVIRNKIPYPIEIVPEVSLKNVDLPMTVYTIATSSAPRGEKEILEATRLAVLPLSNISPDPKDAYFAEGMTEELITTLSQLQGLRVIARTSVDRYSKRDKSVAQIARELRVGSVIEGSVRMAGDKIRVTIQLISGRSEEHLWSEKYDRRLDDVFGIQTEIATQVAKSLKVKLVHSELERVESRAPENASAYASYLKGRTLLASRREAELNSAKKLFESAIASDPSYAPVYSGLADAYILLGEYSSTIPRATSRREARELVSKALEINPNLGEAHATLGLLLARDYDFAGAENEFRRAILLNPSHSNSHLWLGQFVLAIQGRYQECLEELGMAELADPMSIAVLTDQLDWFLLYSRDLEKAAQKVARATQLYPEHEVTKWMHAIFQYTTGNYSQAIDLALKVVGKNQNPTAAGRGFLQLLVMAYAAIGNREEARKWLTKIENLSDETSYRSGYVAMGYAALGDTDQFYKWANRACEEKDLNFGILRLVSADISGMRGIMEDPRWKELFKKAGLES